MSTTAEQPAPMAKFCLVGLLLFGGVAGSSVSDVLSDPEVGADIKNLIETEFSLKRKAAQVLSRSTREPPCQISHPSYRRVFATGNRL